MKKILSVLAISSLTFMPFEAYPESVIQITFDGSSNSLITSDGRKIAFRENYAVLGGGYIFDLMNNSKIRFEDHPVYGTSYVTSMSFDGKLVGVTYFSLGSATAAVYQ